jgi:hypothetical protein
MKLLTANIIRALPPLRSTEHIPFADKTVICKFYLPGGRSWHVFEGEVDAKKSYTFFGMMMNGKEILMGHFYLSDLIALIETGHNVQLDESVFKVRCADVLKWKPVWTLCTRFSNEKIIRALPPIGSTQNIPLKDKTIICKFYVAGRWSWYVFEGEFNPQLGYQFFGMIQGDYEEVRYFAFSDLLEVDKAGHSVLIDYFPEFNVHYSDICNAREKTT